MQTGTTFSQYTNKRALLIAECGNNHEGSLDTALELLERAKESGADVVKFQAGNAEGFARKSEDVERYRKYELGRGGYDLLVARGNELGIPVMFSVWSPEFSYLRDLPLYKVAARQFMNPCTSGVNFRDLPNRDNVIVSIPLGVSDEDIASLRGLNCTFLHCVSEYPARHAFLERISFLGYRLERDVGYSDHTIGIRACIDAVNICKAHVIEKHFTLAHDFGPLRDHQLSATPYELKKLAEAIS